MTGERPSRRFGLRDKVVAWDFDAAAALLLRMSEVEQFAALSSALLVGGGGGEPEHVQYW